MGSEQHTQNDDWNLVQEFLRSLSHEDAWHEVWEAFRRLQEAAKQPLIHEGLPASLWPSEADADLVDAAANNLDTAREIALEEGILEEEAAEEDMEDCNLLRALAVRLRNAARLHETSQEDRYQRREEDLRRALVAETVRRQEVEAELDQVRRLAEATDGHVVWTKKMSKAPYAGVRRNDRVMMTGGQLHWLLEHARIRGRDYACESLRYMGAEAAAYGDLLYERMRKASLDPTRHVEELTHELAKFGSHAAWDALRFAARKRAELWGLDPDGIGISDPVGDLERLVREMER